MQNAYKILFFETVILNAIKNKYIFFRVSRDFLIFFFGLYLNKVVSMKHNFSKVILFYSFFKYFNIGIKLNLIKIYKPQAGLYIII